jgi:hypothetical protein
MDGDAGRATWRTDQRFTQCDRGEAGVYLRFSESTGYELSAIERAVTNGVPYTGDQPEDDLPSAAEQDVHGDPAGLSEDSQATPEAITAEADATDNEVLTEAL